MYLHSHSCPRPFPHLYRSSAYKNQAPQVFMCVSCPSTGLRSSVPHPDQTLRPHSHVYIQLPLKLTLRPGAVLPHMWALVPQTSTPRELTVLAGFLLLVAVWKGGWFGFTLFCFLEAHTWQYSGVLLTLHSGIIHSGTGELYRVPEIKHRLGLCKTNDKCPTNCTVALAP